MYSSNTIERLKAKKKEYRFTNADISKRSGVPISTVNKIMGGFSKYPRQENVEAIAKSLGFELLDYTTEARGTTYMVREVSAEYSYAHPLNRLKTIEDYYNMPEDFRGELINGEIIELKAPSVNHQMVLNELSFLLTSYLRSSDSKCRGFPAPFDVQLDKDQYTMVQPDYVIICDKSKYENGKVCYGAPDLVVEIISPSTKLKDYSLKLYKYFNAGVKEYWVIDPIKKSVSVYSFFLNGTQKIYTFDDVVPSKLFEGLAIDFREIDEMLVPLENSESEESF